MSLLSRCLCYRHFAAIALLATITAASAAPAEPGIDSAGSLAAHIEGHIGQTRFAAASWGIAVVSLDTGRTLYAYRADALLQPASTAKLFTAALSLSTLGINYRIPTRVMTTGHIRDGSLNAALVLYGMGDPTLGASASADWAEQLAEQLAAKGLHEVHGNLIADDSYFHGPSFGSGWEAGDLQSWFAVPSSALSVQENVFNVTVTPALIAGHAATLSVDPADAPLPISGQLTTLPTRAPDDINLYRAPGNGTVYAFGGIAAKSPVKHFRLAMPDPALYAGQQLRRALADHGIRFRGQVQTWHWPQDDSATLANATVLAEVQSPPLFDVLQQGLKRSQNLYLQNLLLSVGAYEQASGTSSSEVTAPFVSTEESAIKALHQLLSQVGVAPSSSLIDEGTGLSRRDLVTPMSMTRLLSYLAAQPYAVQLRDALPIAGVDGTLIGRMRHSAAENNVHAKTGSMTYVHCLTGYVTSAAGERLAFSIMLNNYEPEDNAPSASSDVDAIAIMLADFHGHS